MKRIVLCTLDDEARFWHKVDIGEEYNCWEWLGYKDKDRYGRFNYLGEMKQAHRVAWMISRKRFIPVGLEVCHTCHNPPCINPHHLDLGTHQENMDQMKRAGRANAVLNDVQVVKIRSIGASGKYAPKEIAEMYGVSTAAIKFILNRVHWNHI